MHAVHLLGGVVALALVIALQMVGRTRRPPVVLAVATALALVSMLLARSAQLISFSTHANPALARLFGWSRGLQVWADAPIAMRDDDGDGRFEVSLSPNARLVSGQRYAYKLIVDGTWQLDREYFGCCA